MSGFFEKQIIHSGSSKILLFVLNFSLASIIIFANLNNPRNPFHNNPKTVISSKKPKKGIKSGIKSIGDII